jgi:hypothetical protein
MSAGPIRMGAPADSMQPRKVLPPGRYQVRLDGFKQKLSKPKPGKDQSINFNPQMLICNHPTLNGEKIYTPLNQQVGFILDAFAHCFGASLEVVGEAAVLPGGFIADPNNPSAIEKMSYQGPLSGQIGELELGVNKSDKGKDQNYIKQFFCRVPGCQTKHPTELS